MNLHKSLILVCALGALYGCAAAPSGAAEPAPAKPAEKAPDALEWVASFCEGAHLPAECIRDVLAAIERHKESMQVPNEDLRFAVEQCRKERIDRGKCLASLLDTLARYRAGTLNKQQ